MNYPHAHIVRDITATDKKSLERDLEEAESFARQEGMKHRRGILVTRHSANRFSVAVCESVPFGLTRELSSW